MELATFYDHVKDIARQERVSMTEALQRVRSLGITYVEVSQNNALGQEDVLGHELSYVGLGISSMPAYFDFGRDGDIEKQSGPTFEAARFLGVKKLLVLGSTCIYPKMAPQPIPEDALLTGPLEETNEAYAVAKIAGLEMCKFFKRQYGDDFISCMPTNLYGPYDNYDLSGSHVMPAIIRKFHEAKANNAPSVELWGTGTPLREFLHVDDMADACVFLLEHYDGEQHVNIGTGKEVTIRELAEIVRRVVGYEGGIVWNQEMPDGTPRKLTDVTKLHKLGWTHKIELEEGVQLAYDWFRENVEDARL